MMDFCWIIETNYVRLLKKIQDHAIHKLVVQLPRVMPIANANPTMALN
jgi:hypothetical protein